MAQFIGITGDYLKESAVSRRLNALMVFYATAMVFMFVLGWLTGVGQSRGGSWPWLTSIAALATTYVFYKMMTVRLEKHIRLARMEEAGAAGEQEILPFLKTLPDTYTVVCDLDFADSYGNIDHLVIGPTGLFALDVKNWKGNVTGDGKGELLLNGRPTDKPVVRYFTRRVMELKERLNALTKLDPYIQAVFVFPRTHLEAKWGTTGAVHCIHADKLDSYIMKYTPRNPPSPTDLPRLVSAADALKKLSGTSQPAPPEKSTQ